MSRIRPLWPLFISCNIAILGAAAQEVKRTSPPIQPDYSAEAYVIEESVDRWNFENDGTSTRESSAKVRVQSDAGVQRYGLLTFAYQKAFETLVIDYVRVRKPDGSTVPSPLDDLQDMPSNITREAPFYTDLREKHVAVKGLSAGDVLDFQCHWRQTKPLIPGQFWMALQFSSEDIVLKRQVQVSVPRDRAVKLKSPGLAPASSDDGARRVYTWTDANLERKKSSTMDLAQLAARGRLPAPDIQLSSFQSWEEVGRWYDGLQRERMVPTQEIREKAAELTRTAPDQAAKLRAIYKYVSSEFRYIGVAFGLGRYQPHSAAEVLGNQYGDCKDKHTLLASLLAAAGVSAYPALISSSRILDPDVPSPAQFDHIITVVPQGKETIWLDTTSEVGPFGYLVPPVRDKRALVVFSDKPAVFLATPEDPPFPESWIFKIDAKLDDSGTLQGKVEQTLRGDGEVRIRAALRSLPRTQWKDLIQQVSYSVGFAGEVSDVTASIPESTEAPLHFSYNYKRKDYPDWKNHRISPPAPNAAFTPPEEDGKLPSNFWLGAPGEFQFESRVELPEGYTPELPGNTDLQQESIEYHSSFSREGNVLVAHYRVVLKKSVVSGSAISDYKAFTEKVQEDRERFITLSSGQPQSPAQARLNMQNRIWALPDSSDPKALQSENEAKTALQQGSPQGAMDAFKRAVERDPKFTRDWIFLGQLDMAFGQRDAGLDALRKAVDSAPQELTPYKVLAFAFTSLGRRKEAIGVWQDLAKAAPDDRDLPLNMGILLLGEKRPADAVPFLETAIKLYPDKPVPLMNLATAYLQTGEEDKAVGIFEKVFKLEPGADTKNSVAYELANANKRLDDALRYAQGAVHEEEEASRKVDLSHLSLDDLKYTRLLGAYWDTLGWVHFRLGNLKDAEGYLRAAWTLGQDPVVGYHLGQVYEKLQRKQDAVRMYRLVVGGHPAGAENEQASADARKSLASLPVPPAPGGRRQILDTFAADELSKERTAWLPKLVSEHANAEFYVLFGPGTKVVDTKFISGSEQLRSAGKALAQAHFTISFPENSSGRALFRGILACYPETGCSFVLMPPGTVTSVE